MVWQETLLYFIPLIFLLVQSILAGLFRGKNDFYFSLILGVLVIPFATAFFFLPISLSLFVIFVLISFIFAIFALATESDRLSHLFLFINGIIVLIEYLFLLGEIPLP